MYVKALHGQLHLIRDAPRAQSWTAAGSLPCLPCSQLQTQLQACARGAACLSSPCLQPALGRTIRARCLPAAAAPQLQVPAPVPVPLKCTLHACAQGCGRTPCMSGASEGVASTCRHPGGRWASEASSRQSPCAPCHCQAAPLVSTTMVPSGLRTRWLTRCGCPGPAHGMSCSANCVMGC